MRTPLKCQQGTYSRRGLALILASAVLCLQLTIACSTRVVPQNGVSESNPTPIQSSPEFVDVIGEMPRAVRVADIVAEVEFDSVFGMVYNTVDGLPSEEERAYLDSSFYPIKVTVIEVIKGDQLSPGDHIVVAGWEDGVEDTGLLKTDDYTRYDTAIAFIRTLDSMQRWDADAQYWIDLLRMNAESIFGRPATQYEVGTVDFLLGVSGDEVISDFHENPVPKWSLVGEIRDADGQ